MGLERRHSDIAITTRTTLGVVCGLLCAFGGAAAAAQADDSHRINYVDDIQPIFRQYCMGCHNQNRARNGLKLDTYAGVMEGGSSGPAIEKGNPSNSLLYLLIAHEREPFMPDLEPKLPDEIVAQVREWIAIGAPATKDDTSYAPDPGAPSTTLDPSAIRRSEGEAAMPGDLRTRPYWWTQRPNTVNAVACAPFAPLAAVGGYRQVLLYHAQTLDLLGVLDFPEGDIHVLRFSRDGSLLLAGGGMGAASGRVVAWNIVTGQRVLEVGDEPDIVLAADISEDHSLVALGGPAGVVRVYHTQTGELAYEIDKHTDWVTAIAFSPDGVLLATADRAGGAFVWESLTGREFHTLPTHEGAVTTVSWRADSQMLLTAGDDARVRLLDAERGRERGAWQSHGGILSGRFDRTGRIVTCGRDRRGRLFDGSGKELRALGPMDDQATAIAVSHDGSRIIVGGWTGEVRMFDAADGAELGRLPANPPPREMLAVAQAAEAIKRAEAGVESARAAVEEISATVQEKESGVAAARDVHSAASSRVNEFRKQLASARANHSDAEAMIASLQQAESQLVEKQTAITAEIEHKNREAAQADAALAEAVGNAIDARFSVREAERTLREAEAAAKEHEGDAQKQADVERARQALRNAREAAAVAESLREGALAISERAASQLAALEVRMTEVTHSLESWRASAAPRLQRARQVIAEAEEVFAEHQRLQGEADRAATALRGAEEALSRLQTEIAERTQQLEDAQAALAAARSDAEDAQRAWDQLRSAIAPRGGRVDPGESRR